jgi:hypothetical protein
MSLVAGRSSFTLLLDDRMWTSVIGGGSTLPLDVQVSARCGGTRGTRRDRVQDTAILGAKIVGAQMLGASTAATNIKDGGFVPLPAK